MATLNSVIVPGKALKGGRHKIRISVAHNGEFRYILTDIIIDSVKEFKNGQIVKRPDAAILNTKLRGIMQKCQRAIDELEYVEGLTCPELVYQIKHAERYRHRTLLSIYTEYIEYARLKPGTLRFYASSINCITECVGDKLLVENINHSTILSLDKFMREEKKLKPSTIRNRLVFLMVLLNYAKRCGYAQFRVDPFFGYELPKAEVRQSWLSVDEVRAIRDYEPPTKGQALAKDLFMLSYYLGGINMIDLQDIDFNENTTRIHYIRKKTEHRPKLNKFVEFDIPSEALEIIAKRKGQDGRLALSENQRKEHCHSLFDLHLRKIADALGIPNLIYYSARKSFSQHAFQLGVGTSTIDYILGHRVDKDSTSLYNYITVTPELATQAIKKVLDNLR